MEIKKVELHRAIFKGVSFPQPMHGEIAFAGRSNVGKSSLLNALFGTRIAKTSGTPGKTASINFYNVNDQHFFVDLPGYGFARASKEEKRRWARLVEGYFSTRDTLNMVMILMDCRHPLLENDLQMIEWVSGYGLPYGFVMTKADKLSKSAISQQVIRVKEALENRGDFMIFPVSTTRRIGLDALRNFLGEIVV